jgi:PncC family amidohydrolase
MRNLYPIKDIAAVKDLLLREHRTIAVAESVTAGQLQAALSQADNARQFFQGGITAYNVGQKCRLLRVEPVHALEHNAVSEQVAEEMARHVSDLFCSHFGVGVTGYVAPVPEKGIERPFAFYSVYGRDRNLLTARLDAPPGDALDAQLFYVARIIAALRTVLDRG